MKKTGAHAGDWIGYTTILLPLVAVILHLVGSFSPPMDRSGPGVGPILLIGSLLLVASVPFAAAVAIHAGRRNRPRMKQALMGLFLSVTITSLFWVALRATNAKLLDIQQQIENAGGRPLA